MAPTTVFRSALSNSGKSLFSDRHASKKTADVPDFPAYRLPLTLQFPEYTTRHAYTEPPGQLTAQ
jgi:hypothetical protein